MIPYLRKLVVHAQDLDVAHGSAPPHHRPGMDHGRGHLQPLHALHQLGGFLRLKLHCRVVGLDHHHVGPQTVELPQHRLARPLADAHQADHRGHADGHPQDGEARTQGIGQDAVAGHLGAEPEAHPQGAQGARGSQPLQQG